MQPYSPPNSDIQPNQTGSEPPLSHCGIGITSFVLAVGSFLCLIVLFGVAGYWEATTPGGVDEQAPKTIILGLVLILMLLIVLIALVLGIVSLFQKNKKKIFGILGTVLSFFAIFSVVGLVSLGLAVAS